MLRNLSQGFLNPIKRLAMRLLTTKMPWRARDWRQTRGINFETKYESALSHHGTGFALDVGDVNKFWELRSTLQNTPIVMETRPCFFFSSLTSAFCVFTLVHKDGHVTPNTTLIIMDVERFLKKYTWLGGKKRNSRGHKCYATHAGRLLVWKHQSLWPSAIWKTGEWRLTQKINHRQI